MSQTANASKKGILANWENPMGTDGFEFLEFAATDTNPLIAQFKALGFIEVAKHKDKNIRLFQQGDVRFIVNSEQKGSSYQFALSHGPCACAMGFRVHDAKAALDKIHTEGVLNGDVELRNFLIKKG